MTKEASLNYRATGKFNGVRSNRMESVEDCLGLMEHVSSCDSARCGVRSCFRMKKAIQHVKECKRKGQCSLCKQVIRICVLHAKSCTVTNCRVYFCGMIRIRLSLRQETSKNQGKNASKGKESPPMSVATVGHDAQPSTVDGKGIGLSYDMVPLQRSFSVFSVRSVDSACKVMEVQRATSYNEGENSVPEIIGSGLLQVIGTQSGPSANLVPTNENMDIAHYWSPHTKLFTRCSENELSRFFPCGKNSWLTKICLVDILITNITYCSYIMCYI